MNIEHRFSEKGEETKVRSFVWLFQNMPNSTGDELKEVWDIIRNFWWFESYLKEDLRAKKIPDETIRELTQAMFT